MPEPRCRAAVTARPQSDLVPSHIRFFPALIGGYPALLMSDIPKARFKPPRKVIGFRSPFCSILALASEASAPVREADCGRALARHLFQFGKRRIGRAGAGLAGVFDDAV